MANRHTIARLNVLIGAQTQQFEKAMKQSERKLSGFQKSVNRLPGIVAGAFAIGAITDFTKESIKLAGVAEGVEKAFKGIDGANLNNLREATKGTVSDLELMKAAVNARNFEIPFSKLGSLFEFATKRASETGQSVQQLTSDIITGIGRKSPLILDNLGISAVKLKENLKGVGLQSATTADITRALTQVIDEQNKAFGGTGEEALTLGQNIQSLESNIENLKVALGKKIANSGINDVLGSISNMFSSANKLDEAKRKLLSFSDGAEEFGRITKKLSSNYEKQFRVHAIEEAISKREKLIKKQVSSIMESEGSEIRLLKAYKQNIHYEQIRIGVLEELKNKQKEKEEQAKKLIVLNQDQQKAVDKLNKSLIIITASEGVVGNTYIRTKDRIKAYQQAIIDLKASGIDPAHDSLKKLNAELDSQIEKKGLKVISIDKKAFERAAIDPKKIRHANEELRTAKELITGVDTSTKGYVDTLGLAGSAFEAMGGNMISVFENVAMTGKLSFKSILDMIKQVVARLIAAAAAAAVLAALLPGGKGKLKNIYGFKDKFKAIFTGMRGFAAGGRPPTNKPSLVGERGPELFMPDTAGTVIPNHKLMSSGMGNKSLTLNLVGQFVQRGQDSVAAINQSFKVNLGASNLGVTQQVG